MFNCFIFFYFSFTMNTFPKSLTPCNRGSNCYNFRCEYGHTPDQWPMRQAAAAANAKAKAAQTQALALVQAAQNQALALVQAQAQAHPLGKRVPLCRYRGNCHDLKCEYGHTPDQWPQRVAAAQAKAMAKAKAEAKAETAAAIRALTLALDRVHVQDNHRTTSYLPGTPMTDGRGHRVFPY